MLRAPCGNFSNNRRNFGKQLSSWSSLETRSLIRAGLDKELRSLESRISQQELLLGHGRSGDAAMAPPHRTDLDIIVESETVEIVEGAMPNLKAPPKNPQLAALKGSKNNPWRPTLRTALCLPMRMTC